jgi:hypothetical protein
MRKRHCLERLGMVVDEIVRVDLYLLGSDVGSLWSQRSEGTFVSIGCFGKDWDRRAPEGTALLGKVAEGCG